MSERRRKLAEKFFRWAKGGARLRKVKVKGRENSGTLFTLKRAACNQVRMRHQMAAAA